MSKRSSSLLINESPLQALPSLACLVGITGAIILQQIHYWLLISEHKIEGETWIYNSYDSWAKQFKWLKPRAIQKQILILEKDEYLISGQFKYKSKNNTKWYRIDYDKLNQSLDCEISNSPLPEGNIDGEESNSDSEDSNPDHTDNSQSLRLDLLQSTQENTVKNSSKIIAESKKGKPSPVDICFKAIHAFYGYPDRLKQDPIPNYGKEGRAIKNMIGRGFDENQIMSLWLKKVQERGSYCSMVWVNEDIAGAPTPVVEDAEAALNYQYFCSHLMRKFERANGRFPDGGEQDAIRKFIKEKLREGWGTAQLVEVDPADIVKVEA